MDEDKYEWPRDAAEILGADHPFLSAIGDDLIALCSHRDAGDVVTLGWRHGRKPISFVREWGAHGGAGERETGAFAILPSHAPVVAEEQTFLRHSDLRRGVLRFLNGERRAVVRPLSGRQTKTLRVVTYNVHSCVGLDGRLSPARIARVLEHCDADVVALQELDVMKVRTGRFDQLSEIAGRLGMQHQLFFPAISAADEHYGDGLLSRLPLRLVRAAALPGEHLGPHLERRGALWAAVEWHGGEIQIVNTHLGLLKAERQLQVESLLGPEWLGNPKCADPVILCGDLNMTPFAKLFRRITTSMRDCQSDLPGRRARGTWFAPFPIIRIDHLFVRGLITVRRVHVPRTDLTRLASDHLPLVVDLDWPAVS
ncbi:MAG: hypothetical protein C0483_11400 [Pirellula sp.]|nr:hypothetical protein [Pirellula sp.]